MSSDDTAQLIYLGLLAAALLSYFWVANRDQLGSMARAMVSWALIFLGVIAAYGLWDDVKTDIKPRAAMISTDVIEVPRARDGHYYLTLEINNQPVKFVVDTGATNIVLSTPDAQKLGFDSEDLVFTGIANTANGQVRTARVKLDEVRFGDMADTRVTAWINEGDLDISLLGMSYLNKFDEIAFSGNKLLLRR